MADKIKIIRDISLLFELSLSVGSSLDPQDNCLSFLRTLISRKSLNFGAVWLYPKPEQIMEVCNLYCIHPNFRELQRNIPTNHFIRQTLAEKPYFSTSSQDPNFESLRHEKKVIHGSYAIFSLGDLGFLKLFASNRLEGFPEMEMAQLSQVVNKLKTSLDGCFAHIQLKEETENRLLAQHALEESENKLRRIIDSSLDAVVSVDGDGDTIEWNVQAEKMFGYKREEVLGQQLKDLIIPERHRAFYKQSIQEHINTADESNVNRRYEIKCVRKNGHEFFAELSITADKNDKNILFVGFLRDITDQRKAKIDVEQARMRMENLIINLQAGILLEGKDNKIALVNKAFCNIFSIPVAPEMLIGMDCADAVEQAKNHFINPDEFVTSTHLAEQNKILITNEILYMANGRILERDYIPLFSGEKNEGHLWNYRDITERQNAQQAMQESEEKYRGVLENMELGLLEVDTEDNILRANNAFCQMLGYRPEELNGVNASELFLPESSKKILRERLQERNTGLSSVYELQMRKKEGSLVWGLISGAPIKNAQGQIVGSIGIQFDLTERKKLENELAEAKLIADRARLAERQFLTHMSHEIRTPINAVIGMTHLLDETHPNPVQKEYLSSLRFSADSLLDIVDNILDLSKIDAGEIEFEQRPFDLAYLLKSLLQTFQFKIAEKDLQIIRSVDPAIENLVIGDPTRLNQILTNLLGNALKFTENGFISLSTTMVSRQAERLILEFRVQDSGIGIAPDKQETIFEYFKQADAKINRKFGGTGLGLTIVKQLIEMQGGSIRVESKPGIGSDFIFTLEFGDSGIPLANGEILPNIDQWRNLNLAKGLHFLVVEDNLMNQKVICKTLESWECTFEVANNGVEALSITAENRFDLILMDIHMPILDGFETTLSIRNDDKNPNKNVPIIALTAAALSDDKRRAFSVGMNAFLTKPISPKILQEHILKTIHDLQPQAEPDTTYAPPATELEPVDLSYLMDLSAGDTAFVNSIIDAFLQETPVTLKKLSISTQKQNWEQAGKLVHKLKPAYAMFGMKSLHEMAVIIERDIQSGHDAFSNTGKLESMIAGTQALLPLLSLYKKPV